MGMPLQGLSPGMQDAKESDLGAKTTLWIGSHFQQGRGAGIEQESEQDFPVLSDQRHQRVGNAKDNMKVADRYQFLLPPAKPLLSCIGLSLWAVVITARVKSKVLISAVIASVAMATQSRSAATDNGVENFDLWPRQCSPIPLPKLRSCRANDVGHLKGWRRHDG